MRIYVSIVLLLLAGRFLSQSFRAGAIILDLSPGIEFYNTSVDYTSLTLRPSEVSDKGSFSNANIVMGLEVGITSHFGIQARAKANRFFTHVDEVTLSRIYADSHEYLLGLNWHPVSLERFDLLIGLDGGMSKITFKQKGDAEVEMNSTGFYGSICVNPRFYVKRWGFNVRASVPLAYYRTVVQQGVPSEDYGIARWFGRGWSFSAGIQLKIL
jgi:hypothetical protein